MLTQPQSLCLRRKGGALSTVDVLYIVLIVLTAYYVLDACLSCPMRWELFLLLGCTQEELRQREEAYSLSLAGCRVWYSPEKIGLFVCLLWKEENQSIAKLWYKVVL